MSCVSDTESIALTVTVGDLTADLILDPDPANAAEVGADGLFVAGANESGWFASGETWTSLGADAPNYTITIIGNKTAKYEAGMRAKITQTTDKYFIIVAAAYDAGSGLTTLTLYGGTDYSLTGAAITASYYSGYKKPLGFPTDPTKWSVTFSDAADQTQASPVSGTWYNLGSQLLTIPIGAWDVRWSAAIRANKSTAACDVLGTLSTANNSETDTEFTGILKGYDGGSGLETSVYTRKVLVLAAKTVYYFNIKTGTAAMTSIAVKGTDVPTRIRATSAYL